MNDDLSKDENLVRDFVVESEELLQRIDEDMISLEAAPKNSELLDRIFRALHTMKGTSSFLGFDPLVRLAHCAEDVLNALRKGDVALCSRISNALLAARDQLGKMLEDIRQGGLREYALDGLLAELNSAQTKVDAPMRLGELLVAKQIIDPAALADLLKEQAQSQGKLKLGDLIVEKGFATAEQVGAALADQRVLSDSFSKSTSPQSMRVDVRKLDELINLVGELVLERNHLLQLSRDLSSGAVPSEAVSEILNQTTARLSSITEELQVAGLKTRMVPVDTVFRRFPRLVRDVAQSLRKEVDLVLRGENTELDKTMVELIGDPLVHLVRNCLDHGLELPETRAAAGKPRRGTIRMEAWQEGDQIAISVSDDGAGIDPERIARKAIEKGLVSPQRVHSLSSREVLDFVFLPGFSTAERASDLSGRGVGMDVVRSNLKKMNGSIDLSSQPGSGTTVLLKLPLTLAILPVLVVGVGGEKYGIPLRCVLEIANLHPQKVHCVEGGNFLHLRDEALPLLRLAQIIGSNNASRGEACRVVVLGVAEKKIALVVDELLGQESTVVKPLGTYLRGCTTVAGATVSGDGRVRLVLDPAGLLAVNDQRQACSVA